MLFSKASNITDIETHSIPVDHQHDGIDESASRRVSIEKTTISITRDHP